MDGTPGPDFVVADQPDAAVLASESRHAVVTAGYLKTIAHFVPGPRKNGVAEAARKVEDLPRIGNQACPRSVRCCTGSRDERGDCSSNDAPQELAAIWHGVLEVQWRELTVAKLCHNRAHAKTNQDRRYAGTSVGAT